MQDCHSLAWTSRSIITGSIWIDCVCNREVLLFCRALRVYGSHNNVLARVLLFGDWWLLTSFESEQVYVVVLGVSYLTHPYLKKLRIEEHLSISPIRVLIIQKYHQDYLKPISSFRDDNLSDILIALYRVYLIFRVNLLGNFSDPCIIQHPLQGLLIHE